MRNTLLLSLAVAVVILVFLKVRAERQNAPMILGGPLISLQADEITGLMLTHGGAQFRLDKTADGTWTLSGSTEDFVSSRSMEILLTDLTTAMGGPVLPGTDPEDRRYDFNGQEALRLTVFSRSTENLTLALGTINPVTGHYYASGLNRPGCFMVEAKLRERLAALPMSVELKTLLPAVTAGNLDTVTLWRAGNKHQLEKRADRWWLRVPGGGLRMLGPRVVAYQKIYHDRFQADSEGGWVLASDAAVRLLVYELSKIIVREIKPAFATADWSERWGLADPWRRVVLGGHRINPDPTAGDPDRLELVMGAPLGSQLIPVSRRGVVLLVDGQAGHTLDLPLGELVATNALTFRARLAVTLEIQREGQLVLAGERKPEALKGDGRHQWQTTFPASPSDRMPAVRLRRMVGETVVDLDRMELLAPLRPVNNGSPLQDRELVNVRLTYADPDLPAEETFQVGYLKPGICEDLLVHSDGDPVALWRPATGQLLQVSDYLLTTARNFAMY